jgi:hypothetical protein
MAATFSDLPSLARGVRVQVRCRFDGRWASGFVVSQVSREHDDVIVRVQRLSDGSELPYVFAAGDVRPEA